MREILQGRFPASISLSWVLLALTALPAAGQKTLHGVGDEPGPSAAGAAPGAVLVIDGEEVPAELYARFLLEEVGPPLVREFAEGWAVERQARARGLEVTAAQIEARLDEEIAVRIDGAFHGRREEWIDELARLGRSVDGHRRQRQGELRPLLFATALAADGRVVPEEKVLRDWELEYGPRGRAFDLELLKVEVVVPMPAEGHITRELFDRQIRAARAAGLERALSLRARLEGGEEFAALARARSDDEATREAGGRVERFSQYGWPTGFVQALFDLERGALSQPLFARGGWWLVRVRDWVDTPLESVRAQLVERLEQRGPEQDEVGAAWTAVARDLRVEVQPGMLAPAEPNGAETQGPVALTIDGAPVAQRELAGWLLQVRGESSWSQFAEEWLVRRKAGALGVEVSEAELQARVRETLDELIAQGYKGDRDLWRAYLEASGLDEQLYLGRLARRQRLALLVEKLILSERTVTPTDVEARYRRLFGERGQRVRARVLLLEIPRPDLEPGLSQAEVTARLDAAREARRLDALQLAARARAGADFATLVRRHADDPSTRERGGELEGGFRPDGWPSEVSAAVLALPRGGISDPLLAARFWCVFEVVDVEEVPFEAVREELEQELRAGRPAPPDIAAYRNELLQAAEIEVLPGMRR